MVGNGFDLLSNPSDGRIHAGRYINDADLITKIEEAGGEFTCAVGTGTQQTGSGGRRGLRELSGAHFMNTAPAKARVLYGAAGATSVSRAVCLVASFPLALHLWYELVQ